MKEIKIIFCHSCTACLELASNPEYWLVELMAEGWMLEGKEVTCADCVVKRIENL